MAGKDAEQRMQKAGESAAGLRAQLRVRMEGRGAQSGCETLRAEAHSAERELRAEAERGRQRHKSSELRGQRQAQGAEA